MDYYLEDHMNKIRGIKEHNICDYYISFLIPFKPDYKYIVISLPHGTYAIYEGKYVRNENKSFNLVYKYIFWYTKDTGPHKHNEHKHLKLYSDEENLIYKSVPREISMYNVTPFTECINARHNLLENIMKIIKNDNKSENILNVSFVNRYYIINW